jgi:hypothetical protein
VVAEGGIVGGLLWRLLDNRRAGSGQLAMTGQRGAQIGRQSPRPAIASDARYQHIERDQCGAIAADLLFE